MTAHIMMMISVFFKVFPHCPPASLNPWTVYNHMDAIRMCSDSDPDPPNILESDEVTFFKLEAV